MKTLTRSLALLALGCAAAFAAPKDDPVTKPLRVVINAVRESRDPLALKQFAADPQGEFLLGDNWKKGTDAQRKEFTDLFQTLFAKTAFPAIRENFQHLDQVNYEPSTVNGDKADVNSTILINHPLKKQELKVHYKLVKDKGSWKVIDAIVLGDSMLGDVKQQVDDIFKSGGWDALLKAMRDRAKELASKPL